VLNSGLRFLSGFFLVASFFALIVAVLAWGATYSPSYQKCIVDHARQRGQEETANLHQAIIDRSKFEVLPAFLVCEVTFIDENNGTFTAIATLLLTLVTGGLVIIASRQLRDARAMQRAFISVEPGGIREFDSKDGRIACDIIMINGGNVPAIEIQWTIYKGYSANGFRKKFKIRPSTLLAALLLPRMAELERVQNRLIRQGLTP
jgi:high-affinity Fe2+/Pb2+ permease